jgi:hypothetical protein
LFFVKRELFEVSALERGFLEKLLSLMIPAVGFIVFAFLLDAMEALQNRERQGQ